MSHRPALFILFTSRAGWCDVAPPPTTTPLAVYPHTPPTLAAHLRTPLPPPPAAHTHTSPSPPTCSSSPHSSASRCSSGRDSGAPHTCSACAGRPSSARVHAQPRPGSESIWISSRIATWHKHGAWDLYQGACHRDRNVQHSNGLCPHLPQQARSAMPFLRCTRRVVPAARLEPAVEVHRTAAAVELTGRSTCSSAVY